MAAGSSKGASLTHAIRSLFILISPLAIVFMIISSAAMAADDKLNKNKQVINPTIFITTPHSLIVPLI